MPHATLDVLAFPVLLGNRTNGRGHRILKGNMRQQTSPGRKDINSALGVLCVTSTFAADVVKHPWVQSSTPVCRRSDFMLAIVTMQLLAAAAVPSTPTAGEHMITLSPYFGISCSTSCGNSARLKYSNTCNATDNAQCVNKDP
jgi:hypothetical protein